MPDINFHLEPKQEINLEEITYLGEPLTSFLGIVHKAQKKALLCVLSNVAKYKGAEVLFSMRNQANLPKQYNPSGIGNKPLMSVIQKLSKAKLLQVKQGTAHFVKNDEGLYRKPLKSMFNASRDLIEMSAQNIETTLEQPRHHVELKTRSGKLLEFQPTPYTDHIDRLMGNYCNYLNEQSITLDGKAISHIFLVRKYKDWSNTGVFQFGGRTHHPFMSLPKAKRSRILINGKETTSIDYPASVPNLLYRMVTGKSLRPDDPYKVTGVPRSIAKKITNIMLNSETKTAAASAVNKWLKESADNAHKKDYERAVENIGTNTMMMDAIRKRNKPIANYFFKGKEMGQHYAWLEANLVFEVANYFGQHLKIPCLTIHDEFIVTKDVAEAAEDYLYTVGLDESIYASEYLENIRY